MAFLMALMTSNRWRNLDKYWYTRNQLGFNVVLPLVAKPIRSLHFLLTQITRIYVEYGAVLFHGGTPNHWFSAFSNTKPMRLDLFGRIMGESPIDGVKPPYPWMLHKKASSSGDPPSGQTQGDPRREWFMKKNDSEVQVIILTTKHFTSLHTNFWMGSSPWRS